ncbi:MAG: glycosyltransferase [Firmicutes bacterium]|nr:glycosyltransferase [Bacillota bacterium]
MKIHITMIYPPQYKWARTFEDVIAALGYGLQGLGHEVTFRENDIHKGMPNIILGAHLADLRPFLKFPDTPIIVYNWEQLEKTIDSWHPSYREVLSQVTYVWDYSSANVLWMRKHLGIEAVQVPLGYVPELERVRHVSSDVDVLFLGVVNPRRQRVLDELRRRGLSVTVLDSHWGLSRDLWMGRTKVVINIHQFSENDELEILRVGYCLMNRVPVVSERSELIDGALEGYKNSIIWASYDSLVDQCVAAVQDPDWRNAIVSKGYAWFREHPEEQYLAKPLSLLGAKLPTPS